jgi:hypothetical protein
MKPANAMNWMSMQAMAAEVPLPAGYRFELPRRTDIPDVIAFLGVWFPGISVGAASCYMRGEFYDARVCLEGACDRDVLVVLIKRDNELAAVICAQRNRDALTLYASLAVVAGTHRGARLGRTGAMLMEAQARNMGFGLIYGMATLEAPHMQRALEAEGWQLIGIAPGYDREMVAPGTVKRVFEAVYAKVLVAEGQLLRPDPHNLTSRTRAFFDLLFSGCDACKSSL